MKAEFDKEIDAVLREGARRGLAAAPAERGASAAGGARATPAGAHLDADEQNAYAENSLPAAARTHYAAHLADCDDCRRSVTRLALAAGMPALLEQSATASAPGVLANAVPANVASASSSWRERFGALFAPRAWRYAMPALALLLVGAVALLVLMRERRAGAPNMSDGSIAQQRGKTAETKIAPPELNHAPQNGNTAAPGMMSAEENAPHAQEDPSARADREESAAVRRDDQGQTKTIAPLTDEPAPPPGTGVGTGGAPAPASVAEMPAPTPTPAVADLLAVKTPEAEQKRAAERGEESAKDAQSAGNYETRRQRDREGVSGPSRNSDQSRSPQRGRNADLSRDDAGKTEIVSATPTPASPAATRAKPREAQREPDARSSDDSLPKGVRAPPPAETRTVAGRKFRRAGGAWIDTAYNSSQAVTSVRRNSEQYRALVGDEPALRRISDALGGEVTVVWKGRAYRIR